MTKRLLIILCFFYTSIIWSQLQVKNYFSVTGKKDVAINAICQDKYGFLLLGTSEGVYKFNGKSATPISKDAALKQEISAVYTDKDQTIWIGTNSGKVLFFKNNKLDSLNFSEKKNEEKITSFCEINNDLCIATYGNGLYLYSGKKLKHFDSEKGLSDNVVYSIITDPKGTIWCCTDAGITGISNIDRTPKYTYISNKNGLPDNIVRDITICEDRLVIAMQDSGACYYNLTKQKIEKLPFFSNWSLGTVLSAKSEVPPKLILTTEKNGIITVVDGKIAIYNYAENIQTTTVNKVFIDNTNQIWLASKKGLSQLYSRRYDFINSSKGLTDDKILAITTDNDHTIWAGTQNGILKIMTNDEGKLIISPIADFKQYIASFATKSPDGKIWFGTYGKGIIVIDPEHNKSTLINSAKQHLTNDNISSIYFSNKNTVYISTLGGGLIKATINDDDPDSFKIERTYQEGDGLGSDYVYACITDISGILYVATDGGGLQVLENNTFKSITQKFGLNSNTVFSLCKDQYNNIWATTNSDGIIKYDGKSLSALNMSNGLRDEQPQQIIASENTIYAINSKGIDKINCKTHAVNYYDLFDGDLEPNLNAIYFDTKSIFCGTNNGVLIYRTIPELIDSLKPSSFIKSLQINYVLYPLDSISEFKYNQNNMAFEFGGIWLKNPDKLSYRYILEGLEGNWSYANESKVINYNNLTAGTYKFIVQSKNEEDVWSDEASYSFTILSPIWKRWWFWVLILGIGTISIYTFVKYRLRHLEEANALLEQRVKERTREIEEQSRIIESKNVELEQLSLVASRTDNVVLILDANGKLEYVNESFERLNKISLKELKENYGETIFEVSSSPNIKEIVNDAITNRRSVSYEALNKIVDGVERWDSSTLTPIFDEHGILKKIIIIDTDVTERKKQEQIILQKNKDITDSIAYARKIQHAILPDNALIKKHLPNSFVLYLTKDIVSGDFYWFTHMNGFSIIAAVDCTGHGVPGAFMSLIGYNILNRVVNENKITDPKDILTELNKGILEALYKHESESKDGMDIAICKINHNERIIKYSGAMRPLWIVNSNGLTEIKADKIPIGTKQTDENTPIQYTTHIINANEGDSFYIFTDGYADQFGGSKNKKYSTAKFKELVLKNSTHDFNTQENNIKLEHHHWKGNYEQIDDILVIGFTI